MMNSFILLKIIGVFVISILTPIFIITYTDLQTGIWSAGIIVIIVTFLVYIFHKKWEGQIQKDIEEQFYHQANTKIKSQFLANISHEIRTPMNAILGLINLALKTRMTARQRDYLDKINSSAKVLMAIINDILDYSQIEDGKMKITSMEFQIHDVMDNLSEMFAQKASQKEIGFHINVARDIPFVLSGDSLKLGQILIHLINNAFKFTKTGEIEIKVERLTDKDIQQTESQQPIELKNKHSISKDEIMLKFSIRDTGIGIPQEMIPHLFESFTQADDTMTRKYGGTGLGLAISRKLVQMMDGDVWIESEINKGTTFYFTAKFGQKISKKVYHPEFPINLREIKILIVDDNSASIEILEQVLHSLFFQTTFALSEQEALDLILNRGKSFDLIITDWRIPGIDGIEFSKKIRQYPQTEQIPIILLTKYRRQEDMERAESAGVNAFLIKPIRQSLLFDTIMEVFGYEIVKSPFSSQYTDIQSEQMEKIKGIKVLLVEDNSINQQVAKELLENAGINVKVASNGKEAIKIIDDSYFDLVLMDVQMPVMDGFEATRILRDAQEYSDLPIIAMTAHAMKGDRERCFEVGMNDYLSKPIDPDQLFSTIGRWVRSYRPNIVKTLVPSDIIPEGTADNKKQHSITMDPFPEQIPGIQMESVLKRLGGNKKLFQKLLIEFSNQYSTYAHDISKELQAGNIEKALERIHTIKGLSGNISANDLHEITIELEQAVKNNTQQILNSQLGDKEKELLEKFEKSLGIVLKSAQLIEQIEKNQPETIISVSKQPNENKSSMNDSLNNSKLLKELSHLLLSNNPKSEMYLSKIREFYADYDIHQELSLMKEQINNFNFRSARKTLFKLAEKLGISLEKEER